MYFNLPKTLTMITLALLVNYTAKAQFVESFDNVSTLQSDGWLFINNSDSPSSTDWSQGVASSFPAQAGATDSYVVNTTATTGGSQVCNWLIMPDIGNIEQLSFYTRSQNIAGEVTRMQVMYSPTGAITTGDCENYPVKTNNQKGGVNFGSFQTLLTINQNQTAGAYPQDWTQYTVNVNGNGRIAFLYFVETGAPNFNSGTLAIDTINSSSGTPLPAQVIPTLSIAGLTSLLFMLLFIAFINRKYFITHI